MIYSIRMKASTPTASCLAISFDPKFHPRVHFLKKSHRSSHGRMCKDAPCSSAWGGEKWRQPGCPSLKGSCVKTWSWGQEWETESRHSSTDVHFFKTYTQNNSTHFARTHINKKMHGKYTEWMNDLEMRRSCSRGKRRIKRNDWMKQERRTAMSQRWPCALNRVYLT